MEAGAITVEFNEGAVWVRSREIFGAGAMMLESNLLESSLGAKRVCSDCTVGAGATMAELRAGAVRELFGETFGAGWITELLRVRAARD